MYHNLLALWNLNHLGMILAFSFIKGKKKFTMMIHIILFSFFAVLGLGAPNAGASTDSQTDKNEITHETIIRNPAFTGSIPHVRLKDITRFEGIRDNPLVGYGLVVGLNGSGDTLSSAPYTKESLTSMLERLGVNIRDGSTPSGKNVAAVMVTATLPPFARQGSKIDVTVSALGDAKDLKGGTLLVTPLLGADGEVYSVAQGPVAVSGFSAQGKAASMTKGVPTSGKIANGGIVEKEIGFELAQLKSLQLTLNNPDFTTAQRVGDSINQYFKKAVAKAIDSSTIQVAISPKDHKNAVGLMTEIEQLMVEPDQGAKVIIDDQNGVVVVTSNVKISPIALTHGSITVRIVEAPQVSQPNSGSGFGPTAGNTTIVGNQAAAAPGNNLTDQINALTAQQAAALASFNAQQAAQLAAYTLTNGTNAQLMNQFAQKQAQDLQQFNQTQQQQLAQLQQRQNSSSAPSAQMTPGAQTVVVDNTKVSIKEEKGKFTMLESGANLEEFVNALNLLGASPRDMTAILLSVKAAGVLQAEIIVH